MLFSFAGNRCRGVKKNIFRAESRHPPISRAKKGVPGTPVQGSLVLYLARATKGKIARNARKQPVLAETNTRQAAYLPRKSILRQPCIQSRTETALQPGEKTEENSRYLLQSIPAPAIMIMC